MLPLTWDQGPRAAAVAHWRIVGVRKVGVGVGVGGHSKRQPKNLHKNE